MTHMGLISHRQAKPVLSFFLPFQNETTMTIFTGVESVLHKKKSEGLWEVGIKKINTKTHEKHS